jgi:hypothetical protein
MAFEEIKQDLTEAEADVRSYLENSEEYLQLKVFKILMTYVTAFTQILLVGIVLVLAFFTISIGASLALNEQLDSQYLGFIVIGTVYVLIALFSYFFRNSLNGPLLRKFSKNYFD